jgi:hypothetical protein
MPSNSDFLVIIPKGSETHTPHSICWRDHEGRSSWDIWYHLADSPVMGLLLSVCHAVVVFQR